MQVIIGADHEGLVLKEYIKSINFKDILKYDVEFIDVGTHNEQACDYPVYAKKVVALLKTFLPRKVIAPQATLGILICASGFGMAMVANRHKKIRAVVCRNEAEASMARNNNNANILCLGSKFMTNYEAISAVVAFLDTPYSEAKRHSNRIKQF